MRLDERVAIVTGGGQGLGRAYALAMAGEGARIVVADLNVERAESVAAEVRAAGRDALAVRTDVSSEESTRAMVEAAVGRFGRVDVLVNNAAIFSTIQMKPFDQISVDEWDGMMAVNLRGVFLCCKAVAPIMRQQRSGKIVNIASVVVDLGRADYLHYVTSKAGVIGMTRALANELGDFGVNVNAISPGPVQTEIPRGTMDEEQWTKLVGGQAVKRRIVPDDLVGTAIFLASKESDLITGQTILVDGGSRFR